MTTSRLSLPLLAAAQAQKHVTHNEALLALDALVHLTLIDERDTPPAEPDESDGYLVGASPTGAFAGHAGAAAVFQDGAWRFFAPQRGWIAWLSDAQAALVHDGSAWIDLKPRSADMLGINAGADATNRLAVASPAVLFNHAGAGSQVKVNKAAASDTASVLFQTGFSGRAEFGTAGDDDWHVKTSADGAAWHEALVADRATGAVRFPAGLEHAATRAALSGLVFTPGGDGEVSILRFNRTRSQNPRQFTISSVAGDVLTLSAADANLVFLQSNMQGVSCVRVWNISKSPVEPAWVKAAPGGDAGATLQVTHAAHVAGWSTGETLQLGDQAGFPGVPAGFTRGFALDISPLLQNRLGAVFRQKGIMFKCTAQGIGVCISLVASAIGVSGSFFGGNSLSDGGINITMHTCPTTELSPISNSNLVYVREDDGGTDTLGISGILLVGVWV
ncbi:MAG: DUF2793 domain-containing protein [Hyphomicrobiales bacterium]|nr:DUF2793 domain-containing protein [Hyphomicrobiales bacterium]